MNDTEAQAKWEAQARRVARELDDAWERVDKCTDLARQLYEALRNLHTQTTNTRMRHLDPALLDANLALSRYEQEAGE